MILNSIFAVYETANKHWITQSSRLFFGESQKEEKDEGCLL